MRIIRLLLVVMTLSILTDTHAARMSDYADNTTPNADVYFIGVDPNDTSQTVRGSNYRYSLASILCNGLLDATFKSLTVSGPGDSWLELDNNTSFTDSLTGKYGIRFYNGVLQQIINGTASAIGSGGSAPTLQPDDPDMSDATGWYMATGSGDLFYVNSGIGMWTFAGTYSGDVTDPVIGTVTPSALTHDGTGATLTATITSVTEANEDNRQWSLYDVTDAAVQVDWTTFTGLSITGISIPADQHTYRVDVRCTDLAGNTGTASSGNIAYSGVSVFRPSANGRDNGWTASTGERYTCIDEAVLDAGDYIYTSTAYRDCAFYMQTVPSMTVTSVTLHVVVSSDEAKTNFKPILYNGSTISYYSGSYMSTTSTPEEKTWTMTTNPYTSAAWTYAEINAMQFGAYISSNNTPTRVYQMWIEVE